MASSHTASLLRAAAVRSAIAQNSRMAPRYTRQASHAAEDSHEHGHGAAAEESSEDFSSPVWRNSVLALILSIAVYRISLQYAPGAKAQALDETHSPDKLLNEAKDDSMPYLTRYLAYHMPRKGMWKQYAGKR
ncbi:MAG: hypothetical protein CYPHOPRED_000451 [Cyphobasidiales sp. Tagirdzhanova-0007]|nr:MAG: hypothetical protein CYPHOPRED_000451 [Cyphobasidiales sp. Tagirdzhanova-0007]